MFTLTCQKIIFHDHRLVPWVAVTQEVQVLARYSGHKKKPWEVDADPTLSVLWRDGILAVALPVDEASVSSKS